MTDNKNTNTNTSTKTTYVAKCHTGNTEIYAEPNGGRLFIGGWANGATFDWNTHVIDLTGTEHKFWDIPVAYDEASKGFLPFLMQAYAGWLSLPFPDYGTPSGMSKKEQWIGIKDKIQDLLKQGRDVLVACHGGHGRSGLFCAIVGYLLNGENDPTWANPVEKIRSIHCDEAVETFGQEKFVYNILGLEINITRTYEKNDFWYQGTSGGTTGAKTQFKNCPICYTQSLYVDELGMCLTCSKSFADVAPERMDLDLKDIENKGLVPHSCGDERCMGIWTAQKCGHTVHNQIIYDGLCEVCWAKAEEEAYYAEKALEVGYDEEVDVEESQEGCAMCNKVTFSSKKYGICYECNCKLIDNGLVDSVHNSITDPYKYIAHSCEDDMKCVGIIQADTCGHVVHNREIEDGDCPECRIMKGKKRGQHAV